MPLPMPVVVGLVTANLISGGIAGPAIPLLANGVGTGLINWLPTVVVITTDSGSAGVGSGFMPFIVPLGPMMAGMLASFAVNQMLGPMAPLEAMALAKGVSGALSLGILKTTHSGVGSGTGVVRLIAPPAFPFLVSAFKSSGMKGDTAVKKAKAISDAILISFNVFSVAIPIVGPSAPTAGSGSGIGKII
jgi:ABC-type transport system involved in cytochrome c biogenesis permease subunit